MDGSVENVSTLRVNGNDYTMPELLAYWIEERESIRTLKESGAPKPWTSDPVFQETYFCNVRRENDRVTKWIRRSYTPTLMGRNYELSMVIARIFNREHTLELIQEAVRYADFSAMREKLEEMQRNGEQIWSGAYVITTHGQKMTKLDYCMGLFQEAYKRLPVVGITNGHQCRRYWEYLQQIDGMGSFLSAQVVADLKNTPGHPLEKAEDWFYFSAPGPGSLRGLSWWHGYKVTPTNYHECISRAWGVTRDLYPPAQYIHMQDFQNCLCEFDKYCRVLSGSGRSKRKYPGR